MDKYVNLSEFNSLTKIFISVGRVFIPYKQYAKVAFPKSTSKKSYNVRVEHPGHQHPKFSASRAENVSYVNQRLFGIAAD